MFVLRVDFLHNTNKFTLIINFIEISICEMIEFSQDSYFWSSLKPYLPLRLKEQRIFFNEL